MNVESIGSSSLMYGMRSVNSQQTRSAKANLTQDGLSQMESQMETLGMEVPDFLKQIQANFDKIDTNGDGISSDELQTYAKANGLKLPGQRSAEVRGNTPPAMSKDDLIKMRDDMTANSDSAVDGINQLIDQFDSADTDQDGTISFDEMQTFAQANNITSLLQRPNADGAHGPHDGPPPAMSKDDLVKMRDQMAADGNSNADGISQLIDQFESADTDQDGMVSFDEMQEFAQANNITSLLQGPQAQSASGLSKAELTKMHDKLSSAADEVSQVLNQFDSADTNQDGVISLEEMQAFNAQNGATASTDGATVTANTTTSTSASATQAGSANQAGANGPQQADLLMMLLQQRSQSAYGTYAGVTSANAYLGAGLMA